MSGTKNDSGKVRMSLLSSAALTEMAKVMTYGEKKYDAHNWRKGFTWSRIMDACDRHLKAYNDGERVDPETGLSHLAHAACNLMMLLEFEKYGIGEDDLWKGYKEEPAPVDENNEVMEFLDKHTHKVD